MCKTFFAEYMCDQKSECLDFMEANFGMVMCDSEFLCFECEIGDFLKKCLTVNVSDYNEILWTSMG